MGEMGRKGGSMASTASYYGFIYTIFGLGASHIGFMARAWRKSLPSPVHGLEPAAQQLRPLLQSHSIKFLMTLRNFPICLVASSDGTLTGEAEELKCRVTDPLNLSGLNFSCTICYARWNHGSCQQLAFY
jgi:hypothetical protein